MTQIFIINSSCLSLVLIPSIIYHFFLIDLYLWKSLFLKSNLFAHHFCVNVIKLSNSTSQICIMRLFEITSTISNIFFLFKSRTTIKMTALTYSLFIWSLRTYYNLCELTIWSYGRKINSLICSGCSIILMVIISFAMLWQ